MHYVDVEYIIKKSISVFFLISFFYINHRISEPLNLTFVQVELIFRLFD